MDDIKAPQRPTDVPDHGFLNDFLWSDPSDTALDWEDNERGVSFCFGKAIINEFLVRYDMDLICRAHMVVEKWIRVLERPDVGHRVQRAKLLRRCEMSGVVRVGLCMLLFRVW
jgi:hypothetical protein